MALSKENLYEQLKIDEGVKFEVYNDHLGLPTLGIGHLILEDDEEYGASLGTPVSEERVYELFESDLTVSITECHKIYSYDRFVEWPEEVQEILVNMMFNMGQPRLSKFIALSAAMAENDWSLAADEMVDSRWYRQVGNRAKRLVTRMRDVGENA